MQNIILNKKSKIRETLKAINLNIAGYDCWIPKKFITITNNSNFNIQVEDDFEFKLQKYSPQVNLMKNSIEVQELISEYEQTIIKNKNKEQEDLENSEFLHLFENFDLTKVGLENKDQQ